jgi:hypothetical protein
MPQRRNPAWIVEDLCFVSTGVRQFTYDREALLRCARNALRTLPEGRPGNERGAAKLVLQTYKVSTANIPEEITMGFGKGALLWLLGIPLPIIILLALFWHH